MIRYNFKLPLQGAKTVYANAVLTTEDVSAYRLCFDFLDNGVPYDAAGCALVIKAKRADNQVVTDSGVVTESGDVYYDMKSSVYAVEGELSVEVALCTPQGGYITTHELIFRVRKGHGEAALAAENMTPILSGLMGRVLSGEQKAEAAQVVSEEAAGAVERLDAQVRQNFSNACKAHKTGNFAVACDMSPITHEVSCKLIRKNLLDISKFSGIDDNMTVYPESGKIAIKSFVGGKHLIATGLTLRDICPDIELGKVYKLCGQTNGPYNYILLYAGAAVMKIYFNDYFLATKEILRRTITLLGIEYVEGYEIEGVEYIEGGGVVCEISDVMIIESAEGAKNATYAPYAEQLSGIPLTICGKNLIPKFQSETLNGVTLTVAEDGACTLNGTASKRFYLHGPYIGHTLPHGVLSANNASICQDVEIGYSNGTLLHMISLYEENAEMKISPPIEPVVKDFVIAIEGGAEFNDFTFYPQYEAGPEKTEYEAPVHQTFYTDENGEVQTYSLLTCMGAYANDERLKCELVYNRDAHAEIPETAELIEEITVTEENIKTITRTRTLDGLPYSYKAMYVRYEVNPCTVKNLIQITFIGSKKGDEYDSTLCRYQFNNAVNSNGFISVHADVIGGMWQAIATAGVLQGSPTGVQMWGRDFVPYSGERITKITVNGYDTNIEVSAKIKIYGVRA